MNPEKRDYNAWILCRSTRFHGKYYYFNPATGEAVWNLSDMERRMAHQPNFTHSDKWHAYPEPDCPPEDTSNPWVYQPDYRSFPQASPPFGQAMFSVLPPSMPWGTQSMPQAVYMPPMMSAFNPMPHSWANYRGPKQFMHDRSSFPNNPYFVQKVPYFNQGPNRQVFGMKPKPNNFPIFSQMSSQNRDLMKKRSHTVTENGNEKEPLFKRLRSQIELQNENLFRSSNMHQAQSFESLLGENVSKPTKMNSFQKNNCTQHCDCCILSRSNENLKTISQWSKSQENLTMFDKPKENIFKPQKLQRPRSLESLLEPPSEVSSNFSIENSFVFPLNKADSKTTSVKSSTSVKKVQNSTVSQSGLDKKIQTESSDSKLSETDLRYILMARRKKPVTELKETSKQDQVEVKKVKTSYSEANKSCGESFSKKRVTFDLGVEDMADENPEDTVQEPEMAVEPVETEKPKTCYVVADIEALLAEFTLIDKYVNSEENLMLLIPAHIWNSIESTCVDLNAPRSHLLAARQISRHIARQAGDTQSRIIVQRDNPETSSGETDDPTLNCCLNVYNEECISMLITNNEELINKAVSYELECYTTKDIKEYMGIPKPEVSFDIQKVGNTENGATPADNNEHSRNKLFKNINGGVSPNENNFLKNETRNQFFLNRYEQQKITNDDDRVQMVNKIQQVQVNDRNPFLDNDDDLLEDAQRKIEKLKLQEKNDVQKSQKMTAKKNLEGKDNSVSKNGEAKEDYYTAKKKIKSINVYNLDRLLKSFSIKTNDMEEIIMMRMDEYVCIFCQIMEYVFEDIVKDAPCKIPEDDTKTLVQNQLPLLREVVTDHRTARALVDKLSAVLDKAFVFIPVHTENKVKGRFKLQMTPNEFVKMFACGTLLIQVLKSITNDETLAEGEALLSQLERSLSQWDEAPTPHTPATPAVTTAVEPRPEYVKQRSEIKEYLVKHYPHAHGNNAAEGTELPANRQKPKPEVTEKVTSKVISTFGRNLDRLKLNPGKTIQLCKSKSNEDKENCKEKDNYKDLEAKTDSKDLKAKKENDNNNNKRKTMRKLEFDKFKEIDVEKREHDDKQLTEMLEQMLKKQPLTQRYDLKSIIINKDDNNTEIVKDNNAKDPNKDLKIKNVRKTESEPKITIDNKVHSAPQQIIDEPNNNAFEINRIIYDLDVLDYSEEKEETINDDSSSNRLVIVESDHCNDVTTTNHYLDDVLSNNEENHAISKDSDENNDESVHNENCDSGIDSYQAYPLVQLFLFNLSKTFIVIKQFIEGSISDLSNGIDEAALARLNQKVLNAHDALMKIINHLNIVIDRESNPETALRPMLLKGGPEAKTDKRIIKYKRVLSKCLSQARVLQRSLLILDRIVHKDFLMRDLTDVSDDYSNLFE